MKKYALRFLVTLSCLLVCVQIGAAQTSKTYEFTNGKWFDGKQFRDKKFYSVNGLLTEKRPAQIDERMDLKNGFVIPPFADAHTHNLDGTFGLEAMMRTYLDEGTFYVQVLNNYATGAKLARPYLNKPATLDAVYANGGLTSTLGHPFLAYEPRALGFYAPMQWEANMSKIMPSRIGENNAYWFFDSPADIDAKWDKFLAQKPDVVKIFLLDAANYDKLHNNGKAGDKGLSPALAAELVKRAHAANLRVYAHVETADDFRLGLQIGVDGFAHAPHYGWKGTVESAPKNDLTVADLRRAAAQKVVIIPTANIANGSVIDYAPDGTAQPIDATRLPRIVERQKRLLNLMVENGVTVAFGSDYYARAIGEELWYLHDNKIFDNRTLLRIAVETTPLTIFPNRKIGRLREGYEASFLVLEANPLIDFKAVKNIRWRFKQGFTPEVPTVK